MAIEIGNLEIVQLLLTNPQINVNLKSISFNFLNTVSKYFYAI